MKTKMSLLLALFLATVSHAHSFEKEKEGGNGPGNAGSAFTAYFSGLATMGFETLVKKNPTILTKAEIASVKTRLKQSRVELTNARLCWNAEDGNCEPISALTAKNEPTVGRIRVNPVKFWQVPTELRVQIAVHEYLGLAGIENDGMPISGRAFMTDLQKGKIRDKLIVVRFDRNQLSVLSPDKKLAYDLGSERGPGSSSPGDQSRMAELVKSLCQYLGYETYTKIGTESFREVIYYAEQLTSSQTKYEDYTLYQVSAIDGTLIETPKPAYFFPWVVKQVGCQMPGIRQ